MPGKRRDRAVPRTPGQRLLSRHRVRALSPLPWGGSGTHWRGSRDRPCWGAHATAQRDQGGTGTHGEGARLGQGSRFPHAGRLQGPVGTAQGCWAPSPFPSKHSTAWSCQCQGCRGNQIPASTGSRGCRAPTAQGQPGPAPPGKSSLPCSLGRTPSPAHSQSPAPPAWMTHSSILSVFTLQCQRRQAAWALQWVPIKDGPWQPEGRGKGSAGSLASRDCPEAAAQLSQRNRVWLSPPSGGVWAMPKAAPPVTVAPGARSHHNWERNPASNRRGKSPIALR